MSQIISREIHLKRRPSGMPVADDFELVTVSLPEPGDGQLLVRNLFMSVDPYMRSRMRDRKSYTPPFQLGEVMTGGCVGQVVASHHDKFATGDYVTSMLGWREYYLSDGSGLRKVDPSIAPIQAYLGTLGMPGMTAYVGLFEIGRLREGDSVFVSAAAGAVGAAACQIARIKGCRVVGSAGTSRKVAWLADVLGVDSAFNYREAVNLATELGEHFPNEIDVYFENVGGDHLEAALAHMNDYGRVVCCGMIAHYNATAPLSAPRNLFNIITRRLTLRGFIVSDHRDVASRFYADMGRWIAAGKIKWEETTVTGLENAPEAFIGLFKGENLGKMLVQLAE